MRLIDILKEVEQEFEFNPAEESDDPWWVEDNDFYGIDWKGLRNLYTSIAGKISKKDAKTYSTIWVDILFYFAEQDWESVINDDDDEKEAENAAKESVLYFANPSNFWNGVEPDLKHFKDRFPKFELTAEVVENFAKIGVEAFKILQQKHYTPIAEEFEFNPAEEVDSLDDAVIKYLTDYGFKLDQLWRVGTIADKEIDNGLFAVRLWARERSGGNVVEKPVEEYINIYNGPDKNGYGSLALYDDDYYVVELDPYYGEEEESLNEEEFEFNPAEESESERYFLSMVQWDMNRILKFPEVGQDVFEYIIDRGLYPATAQKNSVNLIIRLLVIHTYRGIEEVLQFSDPSDFDPKTLATLEDVIDEHDADYYVKSLGGEIKGLPQFKDIVKHVNDNYIVDDTEKIVLEEPDYEFNPAEENNIKDYDNEILRAITAGYQMQQRDEDLQDMYIGDVIYQMLDMFAHFEDDVPSTTRYRSLIDNFTYEEILSRIVALSRSEPSPSTSLVEVDKDEKEWEFNPAEEPVMSKDQFIVLEVSSTKTIDPATKRASYTYKLNRSYVAEGDRLRKAENDYDFTISELMYDGEMDYDHATDYVNLYHEDDSFSYLDFEWSRSNSIITYYIASDYEDADSIFDLIQSKGDNLTYEDIKQHLI